MELLTTPRPQLTAPRDRYVYYPNTLEVPEAVAVNVRGRSFKIAAEVDVQTADAGGVLFAHGSPFGGHALYLKDGKLKYVYNYLGEKEQVVASDEDDSDRQVRARRGVHEGVADSRGDDGLVRAVHRRQEGR